MLTRAQFAELFNASLELVRNSEAITKRELRGMSRDLLKVLHDKNSEELYGDVQYINTLYAAVTPVNRKALVLFFREFSGFHTDSETGFLTKKDKKAYEEKREKALARLADPHFNFWSWAETDVKVEQEPKPYDVTKITKAVSDGIKKLGGDQMAVLRAVLAGGITPVALAKLLVEVEKVEAVRAAGDEENKAPF